MAINKSAAAHTAPFPTLRAAWSGFLEILAGASAFMRPAREAQWLSQLSDEELARCGLKRDEILERAFRAHRGL